MGDRALLFWVWMLGALAVLWMVKAMDYAREADALEREAHTAKRQCNVLALALDYTLADLAERDVTQLSGNADQSAA